MNFSRAKTYLIFTFLIVDLFLLYTVITNTSPNLFGADESYNRVVEILKEKNINIDVKENITQINNFYDFTLENVSAKETDFITSLLGSSYTDGKDSFNSKKGVLSFKAGEFEFIPSEKTEFKNPLTDDASIKEMQKMLKELGIDTSTLKFLSQQKQKGEEYLFTFNHYFYNKKLFNSDLTVLASQKGILRVKGNIYKVISLDSDNPTLKSTEEILIRFSNLISDGKAHTITSIEEGYYNVKKEYTRFSVIPAIKITLDNSKFYYFDLTNGKLL